MLLTLVGVLVGVVAIQLVWRLAKWFWAWLGRGETTRRAIDRNLVGPGVAKARAALDEWHAVKFPQRWRISRPAFLNKDHLVEIFRAERLVRNQYLDRLSIGWYQVVMLFFIGSIAGLFLEEIWMLIAWGVLQSRPGLVWGPFSPMYGVGVVLMTLLTFRLRKHSVKPWAIFLIAAVLGGLLEQFTGWAMETFFGAVSWDYTHLSTAITKWVAWPFLIMWGVVGLLWYWLIMPELLYRIGEPSSRRRTVFVGLLALYLCADVAMTLVCFSRRAARDAGIPPANSFDVWVDENFSNEFMSSRFQNMMFDGQEMALPPSKFDF